MGLFLSIVIFQLIAGICILILGAQCFVKGASGIARYYNLPPLFIGIVLVGLGTSCPEIVVSLIASLKGSSGIAIGNAIGSNIANMGLVLGVTALILPLEVRRRAIKFEMPVYLGSCIVLALVFYRGAISRLDGIFMLLALLIYLVFLFNYAHKSSRAIRAEQKYKKKPHASIVYYIFLWCMGLVLVILSADWIVTGAQDIARYYGLSELLIGLTIVAIGTTLPELAATVVSAFNKEHDIAVGNIIGSNIFNLLAVLAMPALFAPGKIAHIVFVRDYLIMFGFGILLFIMILLPPKYKISRLQATILLALFVCYLVLLYYTNI